MYARELWPWTLLGIASGVLTPDAGTVEIAGRRLEVASAAEAQRLGLGMAYQTFSEVRELSVAENLYLSTPHVPRDLPTHLSRILLSRQFSSEHDRPPVLDAGPEE